MRIVAEIPDKAMPQCQSEGCGQLAQLRWQLEGRKAELAFCAADYWRFADKAVEQARK